MKRALIVWGGLELHEPEAGAHIVRDILASEGFDVTVTGDYTALGADADAFDLIVPQITGGELDRENSIRFCAAIEAEITRQQGMPPMDPAEPADRGGPPDDFGPPPEHYGPPPTDEDIPF